MATENEMAAFVESITRWGSLKGSPSSMASAQTLQGSLLSRLETIQIGYEANLALPSFAALAQYPRQAEKHSDIG